MTAEEESEPESPCSLFEIGEVLKHERKQARERTKDVFKNYSLPGVIFFLQNYFEEFELAKHKLELKNLSLERRLEEEIEKNRKLEQRLRILNHATEIQTSHNEKDMCGASNTLKELKARITDYMERILKIDDEYIREEEQSYIVKDIDEIGISPKSDMKGTKEIELLCEFGAHIDRITGLIWIQNSDFTGFLLSSSMDGTIKVWDINEIVNKTQKSKKEKQITKNKCDKEDIYSEEHREETWLSEDLMLPSLIIRKHKCGIVSILLLRIVRQTYILSIDTDCYGHLWNIEVNNSIKHLGSYQLKLFSIGVFKQIEFIGCEDTITSFGSNVTDKGIDFITVDEKDSVVVESIRFCNYGNETMEDIHCTSIVQFKFPDAENIDSWGIQEILSHYVLVLIRKDGTLCGRKLYGKGDFEIKLFDSEHMYKYSDVGLYILRNIVMVYVGNIVVGVSFRSICESVEAQVLFVYETDISKILGLSAKMSDDAIMMCCIDEDGYVSIHESVFVGTVSSVICSSRTNKTRTIINGVEHEFMRVTEKKMSIKSAEPLMCSLSHFVCYYKVAFVCKDDLSIKIVHIV